MRLTKKTPFGGYDVIHNYDEQGRDEEECIHKLGQFEDIEEDFEIDLIKLFKAVQNGFYDNEGNYYEPYDYLIDLDSSCLRENFEEYIKAKTFSFEDYGQTWALTKEELL